MLYTIQYSVHTVPFDHRFPNFTAWREQVPFVGGLQQQVSHALRSDIDRSSS